MLVGHLMGETETCSRISKEVPSPEVEMEQPIVRQAARLANQTRLQSAKATPTYLKEVSISLPRMPSSRAAIITTNASRPRSNKIRGLHRNENLPKVVTNNN